jgi:MoxR-like ATPase
MLRKRALGQDILLLGPPPSTYRRRLAFDFARACGLEVEYIVITTETTEADLKLRRELKNGQLIFHDQAPVRAALQGKILILDGLERAERNVLPSLNNLLENREMNLDDGRLLVHHQRFDMLQSQQQHDKHQLMMISNQGFKLLPVSPNFMVVALALPVPPFVKLGRPLDPPLRSRFQARVVIPPSPSQVLSDTGIDEVPSSIHYSFALKQTEQYLQTVNANLSTTSSVSNNDNTLLNNNNNIDPADSQVDFLDAFSIHLSQQVLIKFPLEPVSRVLNSCAPFLHRISPKIYDLIVSLPLSSTTIPSSSTTTTTTTGYTVERNHNMLIWHPKKQPSFENNNNDTIQIEYPIHQQKMTTTMMTSNNPYISSILQDLIIGQRHILMIGEVGCGKSRLAQQIVEFITGSKNKSNDDDDSTNTLSIMPVTKDTTARDLLVRRAIDPITGDSFFVHSLLVDAAKRGGIVILDGVERLEYSAFVSLTRILMDGLISLPDGTNITALPSFRVIAIASVPVGNPLLAKFNHPSTSTSTAINNDLDHNSSTFLFSNEITSCFATHVISLNTQQKRDALIQYFTSTDTITKSSTKTQQQYREMIQRVMDISHALETDGVSNVGLSLRQMFRLVRLCENDFDLKERLENAFLSKFMPMTKREAFDRAINRIVSARHNNNKSTFSSISPTSNKTHIMVVIPSPNNSTTTTIQIPKFTPGSHPELIPSVRFHDNSSHSMFMNRILLDFYQGERDFIAIGAQGVGKNKIADRLCELLGAEREYIQLHRDSTVSNIILSPSVEHGKIVYSDSPLVRAAKYGRVLVIDEADKAPAEVLGILKSLVEDGEMYLGDGRKLVRNKQQFSSNNNNKDIIPCHPNFCIWILANRPGFPFLGNEFTRALSDVFSIHVLHNPDQESELALLQSYAPNVDKHILTLLASAFAKLRDLSDIGVLAYPFSARDAVAVARHLEGFPSDGVLVALENVLDFDLFVTPNIRIEIERAFHSVGIPFSFRGPGQRVAGLLGPIRSGKVQIAEEKKLPELIEIERWKKK